MIRALLLCLVLAAPVQAQTRIGADGNVTLDVGAVAEQTVQVYNDQGADASFRYLDATMRDARGKGWLTADSGVLFAMYADALRNIRLNPAYAVRVADEGLALIRNGNPKDPRDAQLLEASRAYALADMGQFDEAVAAATLAIPMMREAFGAQAADDLATYVVEWQAGKLTSFNESALELARKALERAEKAVDASDHAAVLAEASRAMLPPGAGFDADEVALLNAEARALAGRALYLLRRPDAALAMLNEGASGLYGPDWRTRPSALLSGGLPEASQARVAELFYWIARIALENADWPLAEAALGLAERHQAGTDWPGTILLIRMQLAVKDGDHARVDALTERVARASRAEGDEDFARLAEFYRATGHASIVPTWDEVDVIAIVRAARSALENSAPGSAVDPGFIHGEVATFLILTENMGAGLMAAREARMNEMMKRADATGPAAEAHAERMRNLAELHLLALNTLDSRSPGATCFDADSGRGCVIVLDARK